MPKLMTIAGGVVALLIAFVFGFDLALGFPFKRASPTLDICLIVCAVILGYMAWSTHRELT